MTNEEIIALFVLAGVLFTAISGVIAALVNGKQKSVETVVAALREQVEDLRAQVKDNDARIAKLERRDRAWSDYVHLLRAHITAQKPPPPPEWPAGLDR